MDPLRPISPEQRRLATALLVLVMTPSGCDRTDPPEPEPIAVAPTDSIVTTSAVLPGEVVFERELLFLSLDPDSLVLVPWRFRSRVTPDGVHREQGAWLGRAESWEVLAQEERTTEPTRSPWQILPGGTIRLVVGSENQIGSLLLRDPPRELETSIGDMVTEWADPGAEFLRIYEGRTVFPAGAVDGLVVEISRRWETSEGNEPGDWAFLHSGLELQFFVQSDRAAAGPEEPVRAHGWTRLAVRDVHWPDLELTGEEMRAHEPARRDIPSRWRITTSADEISGELELVSAHIVVGEGEGAILPLVGLFEVSGTMRIDGREFPVAGMIRHVQQ